MEADCTVETGSCFPADAVVSVTGKGETLMRDLKPSDKVLTVDPKTGSHTETEFLDWIHINESSPMKFLKFFTESGVSIEISADHQIFTKENGFKLASDVKVGVDSLMIAGENSDSGASSSKVIKVTEVEKTGVYAPLTWSGTLTVNGV